ncbi:insulinase family protein [Erysipelothrix enhydrae]|uniref:M16 family metallopeptidase n=1 Tax=Erysipelothrix enhydrae TaxID=2890314 RepID=UPI002B25005B|nr:insulinase family protein [Erysipelothrix sp. 4322-04]WRB86960.1 insulinase family protein [Erysipelothrix sp. 4322-04]
MNEELILKNDIKVYQINEEKFHEVYLSLKIVFKLESKTNTIANLLTRMMGDRLIENPTKTSLAQRHDMLYGAKTSALTYTLGTYQVIDLGIKMIHERFTNELLLDKQIKLLEDMYLYPLLTEQTLEEAKKNLRISHMHIKENASQNALVKGFKHAGEGQLFGLSAFGDLGDLDSVSLKDVQKLHTRCIQEFNKQIYLVGGVDRACNFDAFTVGHSMPINESLLKTEITETYLEERYKGTQSELVCVYETSITPYDDLYYAYLVFIAYLGQLPTSLLFQNIREKHSLCYSIYASRQVYDGIFYIATGVSDKNVEKTLSLIEDQFEIIRNEPLDLTAAINYLDLSLEGNTERIKSIADHTFRNNMLQVDESIEIMQEKIRTVTESDVKAVLTKITKPFVFAYRGENNENN